MTNADCIQAYLQVLFMFYQAILNYSISTVDEQTNAAFNKLPGQLGLLEQGHVHEFKTC